MWRIQDGDRVLTETEWEVFRAGLDLLRDFVEQDIAAQEDNDCAGVAVFDRLTSEQKLVLLAEVASALRDPAIPAPDLTAVNEGTVMAVLKTFCQMLQTEVEDEGQANSSLRAIILGAVADEYAADKDNDDVDPPPKLDSREWDDWHFLWEGIVERLLWDFDFDAEDGFLDLPLAEAREKLEMYDIPDDYFLTMPDEPNEQQLITARQTLAKLIGLKMP